MIDLILYDHVGEFAENKDVAQRLRTQIILPALQKRDEVTLDFANVSGATQSFIHALISDLFRKYGSAVLDRLNFKNCNDTIRKVITIVCDYMQEAENA